MITLILLNISMLAFTRLHVNISIKVDIVGLKLNISHNHCLEIWYSHSCSPQDGLSSISFSFDFSSSAIIRLKLAYSQ